MYVTFLHFYFLVNKDIIYIACTLLSEMEEWPGMGPVRIWYWYSRAPDPNPGFSLATYRNARCSKERVEWILVGIFVFACKVQCFIVCTKCVVHLPVFIPLCILTTSIASPATNAVVCYYFASSQASYRQLTPYHHGTKTASSQVHAIGIDILTHSWTV